MATLNKYGNLPIGSVVGMTVMPTPAFQFWLEQVLERTGGVDDSSLSAAEYDTFVGAPIGMGATVIDGGPVPNEIQPIDGGPV